MKRVIIALLILLSVAFIAWSQSDEHSLSLDQVIEEFRGQMGMSSEQIIDPDAVPVPLLEELGDAVMAEIHPNERIHSWMDGMMGGEHVGAAWA